MRLDQPKASSLFRTVATAVTSLVAALCFVVHPGSASARGQVADKGTTDANGVTTFNPSAKAMEAYHAMGGGSGPATQAASTQPRTQRGSSASGSSHQPTTQQQSQSYGNVYRNFDGNGTTLVDFRAQLNGRSVAAVMEINNNGKGLVDSETLGMGAKFSVLSNGKIKVDTKRGLQVTYADMANDPDKAILLTLLVEEGLRVKKAGQQFASRGQHPASGPLGLVAVPSGGFVDGYTVTIPMPNGKPSVTQTYVVFFKDDRTATVGTVYPDPLQPGRDEEASMMFRLTGTGDPDVARLAMGNAAKRSRRDKREGTGGFLELDAGVQYNIAKILTFSQVLNEYTHPNGQDPAHRPQVNGIFSCGVNSFMADLWGMPDGAEVAFMDARGTNPVTQYPLLDLRVTASLSQAQFRGYIESYRQNVVGTIQEAYTSPSHPGGLGEQMRSYTPLTYER